MNIEKKKTLRNNEIKKKKKEKEKKEKRLNDHNKILEAHIQFFGELHTTLDQLSCHSDKCQIIESEQFC